MISREEAKLILEDMYNASYDGYMNLLGMDKEPPEMLKNDMEALKIAIEALSQPERPKGRWKRCKYAHKLGECSLCGEIVEIESNFCPNCGADMRGEEE